MIQIAVREDRVEASAIGHFILEDIRQLEDALLYRIQFQGQVDLLLDLRDMVSYSVDVAWEELKFSRAHPKGFGRIAVLTNDEWVKWSLWLNRAFTDADIMLFDDLAPAQAWLAGSPQALATAGD